MLKVHTIKTFMDKSLILNRIKKHYNFTTDIELADFLGISKSTLSNWYKRNSIDYDLLFSKCELVDKNWLLTGEGSSSFEKEEIDDSGSEVSIYKLRTDYYGVERQRIPLYEIDASAGLNMLFSSQNTQIPLDYITVPNAPKCDGALFVRGDSMYPILKAGDIICYKTVHSIDNLIRGEMYVLDIDNGEEQYLTVKFVKKSDKGSEYVTLVSENKHHADRDIRVDSIRALGLIKLSIRYNTIS
ncbi:MAG: S24 family peptidase [Dysgonomonas sp.]|uniref:S24 family peptidase n=1 Tax=Dysgonomonas sp. TaxID=1891233 RepID=UPI0039E23441